MDETTFEKYVEYACWILRHLRRHWGETLADALAAQYFAFEVVRKEILQDLIRCSGQFKPAWDALGLIARHLRRTGTPFPDELADWLVELEVLGGPRRRPKTQRKGPYCNYVRNVFIFYIASQLKTGENINATRAGGGPENCCREGGTACDVAGEAIWRVDKKRPKYKSIEHIVTRRNKQTTYISIAITWGGLHFSSYRDHRWSCNGDSNTKGYDSEEFCPEEFYVDESDVEKCRDELWGNLYDILCGKSWGKFYDVPIGTDLPPKNPPKKRSKKRSKSTVRK